VRPLCPGLFFCVRSHFGSGKQTHTATSHVAASSTAGTQTAAGAGGAASAPAGALEGGRGDAGSASTDAVAQAAASPAGDKDLCEILGSYSSRGPTSDRCRHQAADRVSKDYSSRDDRSDALEQRRSGEDNRSVGYARPGASVACGRRHRAAGRDTDGTTQYACDDAGSRHLCSSRDDCSDALEHQAAGRDDDGTTRHYA
jgi:hypothetical protein